MDVIIQYILTDHQILRQSWKYHRLLPLEYNVLEYVEMNWPQSSTPKEIVNDAMIT
jgi:hypothetical protein